MPNVESMVGLRFRSAPYARKLVGTFQSGRKNLPSAESVENFLEKACARCPFFEDCSPRYVFVHSRIGDQHVIVGAMVPKGCPFKDSVIPLKAFR